MAPRSEKSIFLTALERQAGRQRDAFVAEACGGDAQLRAQVEDLLRAQQHSGGTVDQVPAQVVAVCPAIGTKEGQEDARSSVAIQADDSFSEHVGTNIGPYKLMELIGQGGFGLVFVAEQQQPVRRKVALKLIKPGMGTREVIARFEAERQALALMDHPNIARVFDAGETASGCPYFVMELVRGIPITDFCDQYRLNSRDRLELFVHVCHAVQHAHQKAIIHRDLKPSNVLVTLHDGTPLVKVIDFGVAKAIGQQLTDKTIYTRFTEMIGTPMYMSPEQAEMSESDVDTRSDIYSLGVLLYELLTSTTPFDRETMRTAAFDEIRRIIREEEPPSPSTRLARLGAALSTVSAKRRTEPKKLCALIRSDLDWIVMKALEKSRSRRYDTVAALADDIERFLHGEPVVARPPSPLYRFQKFARRNKVALTTGLIVAVALALGTAVSTWQAVRARLAQADADASRKRAEDFAERLKAANVLLDNARADEHEQRWDLAQKHYTKAAELQPDHYLVWSGRGTLYLHLGLWELAASDYAKAVALGAPANNPRWWGVPQLFLYAGDEHSYREACARILQQVDNTSDRFAAVAAIRSCSVADPPANDPADSARRAEALLNESTQQSLTVPERSRGSARRVRSPRGAVALSHGAVLYIAGLADYREGSYEQSIKRLSEATTVPGWSARAISYPVLAMAYQRTGQGQRALEAITSAQRQINQWTDEILERPVGTMPIPWLDWIECLCLYREAHALVKGSALPDDPRLKEIQRRAAALLDQP
jgi:serine/threonine protein kinase/Tfp pilus assembly protein PilF